MELVFTLGVGIFDIQGPTEKVEDGLDSFGGIDFEHVLSGMMGLLEISDLEGKEKLASAVKLDEISKLELKHNLDSSHYSHYFDTLSLAKQWLQECCSVHTVTCAGTARKLSMPTRLLAIQGGTTCLQVSAELPIDVRYATLSHCWANCRY